MSWHPERYLRFARERTRPAEDLLARVSLAGARDIVDVGCGPGNSTALLAARWPDARIDAFDSSPQMLATARETHSRVNWFEQDVSDWSPSRQYDLIFSNAVLQWVPDHEHLLPRLAGFLRPGGVLAVQLPAHFDSPLHHCLLEIARLPRWHGYTQAACNTLSMAPASFYHDVLGPVSASLDMWYTEYLHVVDAAEDIFTWFSATGLRPFLDSLPDETERAAFRDALIEGYRELCPPGPDGRVLFPFRRFFFVAEAPGDTGGGEV